MRKSTSHPSACYIPRSQLTGSSITLAGEEASYLIQVLRLGAGAALCLMDGEGGCTPGCVQSTTRRSLEIEITGERQQAPVPRPALHLYQALPKNRKIDLVIQKGVELGLSTLHPLAGDRSVRRLDEAGEARQLARWKKVAISAIKQSGNPWLPEFAALCTPVESLQAAPDCDLIFLAHPDPQAPSLLHALTELSSPRSIGILIGPEGGFAEQEVDALCAGGARPVRLAPHILRTETAAICALSQLAGALR